MQTSPSTRSRLVRTLNLFVATTVLAGSVAFAPAQALASKRDSDRIGGVKLSSGSVSKSKAPDINARSGIIVTSTGRVLWSRKAGTERAMASTTKVMTALLVLENCKLTDTVKITRTAARTPYATGLRAGERLTVRKLLELLLVCSSNDAATALAIHTGGSVKKFAKMMNERADELGLEDTHYKNPHGLDAKGHYTSAKDLSTLMRVAVKKKEFRRIIKMKSVKLPAYRSRHARRIKSTDKLLGTLSGLRGGKTGFTDDAKYCFVGNATRDGIALTSVVLGSSSSARRFSSSKRLLRWGFKHYRNKKLATAGTVAATVRLSTDSSRTVTARYSASVTTPVLDLLKVTKEIDLPDTVTPPIAKGQVLGVVRFVQGSEVIAKANLVAGEAIAAP